jgi:hypothetical protein
MNRHELARSGTQSEMRLAFGVYRAPVDAPAKIVRQIDSAAQALAVSMRAGKFKNAYVAACIGKDDTDVSRMKRGRRPIPEKLVGPLCAATGSNLLSQFLSLQAAIEADEQAVEARLADELRSAA